MKILFLTTTYPEEGNPNRGIFVRDQAETLATRHEIEVVFAKIDYSKFSLYSYTISKKKCKGVVEHHITIKRSLPIINQLVFFLITICQTVKIARIFSPDIVHGNLGFPGAFWSLRVARAIRKPVIISEHSRITNNFRSAIHKLLVISSLKRVNAVVCVSDSLAAEAQKFTPRKVAVVPNIIDFSKFPDVIHNSNAVCQIGFLGGLNTPVKGLDLLLRAAVGIKEEFILHIGGEGILLESYKALAHKLNISDKCVFYGFVHNTEVNYFMSRLHFFVSASRYETFGMAMVEAMACGLPVVATNSGGPADFINDKNGLLVEKENVEALKNSLIKMISEYKNYDVAEIREFALSNYSSQQFLTRIEKVYADVFDKPT